MSNGNNDPYRGFVFHDITEGVGIGFPRGDRAMQSEVLLFSEGATTDIRKLRQGVFHAMKYWGGVLFETEDEDEGDHFKIAVLALCMAYGCTTAGWKPEARTHYATLAAELRRVHRHYPDAPHLAGAFAEVTRHLL